MNNEANNETNRVTERGVEHKHGAVYCAMSVPNDSISESFVDTIPHWCNATLTELNVLFQHLHAAYRGTASTYARHNDPLYTPRGIRILTTAAALNGVPEKPSHRDAYYRAIVALWMHGMRWQVAANCVKLAAAKCNVPPLLAELEADSPLWNRDVNDFQFLLRDDLLTAAAYAPAAAPATTTTTDKE